MIRLLLYLCEALAVGCLLTMAGFGLRRLVEGPRRPLVLGTFGLMAVVFMLAYALADPAAYPPARGEAVSRAEVAGVYTALVLIVLSVVGLAASAVRGVVREVTGRSASPPQPKA